MVIALLDDGSNKMYLNTDVAAELLLQSKIKKVMVNMINSQVDSFQQCQLNFSSSHQIKRRQAFTVTNVTGNLKAVLLNV